jgi:hypothetical protein
MSRARDRTSASTALRDPMSTGPPSAQPSLSARIPNQPAARCDEQAPGIAPTRGLPASGRSIRRCDQPVPGSVQPMLLRASAPRNARPRAPRGLATSCCGSRPRPHGVRRYFPCRAFRPRCPRPVCRHGRVPVSKGVTGVAAAPGWLRLPSARRRQGQVHELGFDESPGADVVPRHDRLRRHAAAAPLVFGDIDPVV